MGELYDKTIKKLSKLKEMNYNIEVIWEDEWNYLNKMGFDEEITEEKMREFLGKKYVMPIKFKC